MKSKIIYTVSFLLFLIIGFGVFFTPVASEAAVVKVGDKLTIGKYEQDGNAENGAEPISWTVVSMGNGKAVVFADNILDMIAYSNTDATWSSSALRLWLNDTFYKSAFSDAEKSFIYHKKTITKKADNLGLDKTEDYVFVLSASEAKGYFENCSKSAKPTAYALKKGLFTDEKTGFGYWWLREPGNDTTHTAYVNPDGSIYSAGCKTSYAQMGGIRPAMQIDLNKSGFGGNTLTIKYVYSNGKTAKPDYVAGITAGETYNIKTPAISGCAPDKASVTGVMGTEDVTITVKYNSGSKIPRQISAPVKISSEKGKVTLKAVNPNGYGYLHYGYSLKNDINTVSIWSESREFTGLVGGNTYYFFARVVGSTVYIDAFSEGTAIYVEKTERTIAPPQILNFNHNGVAGLEITPNGGGQVLYGVSASNKPGNVKTWSKYPVFNGLSSGVKYYLFAKVAETDNFKEAYSSTEFTTLSSKTGTEIPTIKAVTESSIEVNRIEMLMGKIYYGISETPSVTDVKNWTEEAVFNGLKKGVRYYIFTKVENNSLYASTVNNYSSVVTVTNVRVAAIPEIESVIGVTVTVKPVTAGGSDFSYFGISRTNDPNAVSVWQTENIFNNLLPDTEYYVFTKLSNGNTAEDIISSGVYIKTARGNNPGVFSSNQKNDDSFSLWWIILIIVLGTVLIGFVVYVLIKKKIIFKNFKGFGGVKAIFVSAFSRIDKNGDSDNASETDDDFEYEEDSVDDDFDDFDDTNS